MKNIQEIKGEIEKLPANQVQELADWLDALRQKPVPRVSFEDWLERTRGLAIPGVRTDDIMWMTRGEH